MQKIFALLLFLLAFSTPGFSHSMSSTDVCKSERIYIDPSSVLVTKKGIFIITSDCQIPCKTLSSDNNGIFVTLDAQAKSYVKWIRCGRCGYKYAASIYTPCPKSGNRPF